jgi:hypothetical protein
MASILATAGTI